MIVGIPKEIKNNEYRVSLTPAGAMELVRRGHTVYIQSGAGVDSGFADKEYQAVGAKLLPTIEEVYATAEMIIKVKEPIAPEYGLVRPGQLLFTYFHFASSEALTRAMIASGAVCCAYETVERSDRSLPLLIPMSEVAGRMAAQEGRYFLEKPRGGKGILLGGVPGVKPAKVFVIGAGVVGTAAARTAAGTGADVTICDVSLRRLTYLADVMPRNVKTLMSSEYNIREDILLSFENNDLSDAQARALLRSAKPLADLFKEYDNRVTEHMDSIWDAVESHADELHKKREHIRDER